MKIAHLIVVGKLKDRSLESIEADYLTRINGPKLQIHEVRANAEKMDDEAREVLKKINDVTKGQSAFLVALTEFGKEYDSPTFSSWIFDKIEQYQHLVFVIAGAQGHGSEFLEKTDAKLSLSKLTFPHKLARILFIEQFYRAITIKNQHPYHN